MPAYFPPIQALASVAHKWINAISGAGVATATQPAASDLSDTIAITAWTPSDASGASLSLTVNNAYYWKYGKIVYFLCNVSYPSTGDSHGAAIGGFPVNTTVSSRNGTFQSLAYTGLASTISFAMNAGTNTGAFYTDAGGLTVSNATLTGADVRFSGWYATD